MAVARKPRNRMPGQSFQVEQASHAAPCSTASVRLYSRASWAATDFHDMKHVLARSSGPAARQARNDSRSTTTQATLGQRPRLGAWESACSQPLYDCPRQLDVQIFIRQTRKSVTRSAIELFTFSLAASWHS